MASQAGKMEDWLHTAEPCLQCDSLTGGLLASNAESRRSTKECRLSVHVPANACANGSLVKFDSSLRTAVVTGMQGQNQLAREEQAVG